MPLHLCRWVSCCVDTHLLGLTMTLACNKLEGIQFEENNIMLVLMVFALFHYALTVMI